MNYLSTELSQAEGAQVRPQADVSSDAPDLASDLIPYLAAACALTAGRFDFAHQPLF